MFSTITSTVRSASTGKQCLAMCALGLATSLMPAGWFDPAREAVERVLVPGQQALGPPLAAAANLIHRVSRLWHKTDDVIRLEDRVGQLEAINRQLRQQLLAAAPAIPVAPPVPESGITPPLLDSSLVPARTLGRQARGYLARRDLLDIGSAAGAKPDALVLGITGGEAPLIDAGQDLALAPHQRALATVGGVPVVWGKLVDVGRMTSTLRRSHDAGYRDLAQLAHVTRDGLRWGARGVLEGDGTRLCRFTRVHLDTPVDVGDLVFAADSAGLRSAGLDSTDTTGPDPTARLLYGSVVRIERPEAEAHWKIWVEPVIAPEQEPQEVAVVTMRLNPARLARVRETTTPSKSGAANQTATPR